METIIAEARRLLALSQTAPPADASERAVHVGRVILQVQIRTLGETLRDTAAREAQSPDTAPAVWAAWRCITNAEALARISPDQAGEAGWYLHYIWSSRLTAGIAKITHKKSAEKRNKSKVTSQRWTRKLHRLGLVERINMPDPKHGGLDTNRYRPMDPAFPDGPRGDALAIVYGGQLQVLTAQAIEIPPLPNTKVAPEKPKPGPYQKRQVPGDLPLPPALPLAVARKANLYDALEIRLLWADHLRQRQAAEKNGRPIRKPMAYWFRACQNRARELQAAGVEQGRYIQTVIPLHPRSPEREQRDRHRYMVDNAAQMLARGSTRMRLSVS